MNKKHIKQVKTNNSKKNLAASKSMPKKINDIKKTTKAAASAKRKAKIKNVKKDSLLQKFGVFFFKNNKFGIAAWAILLIFGFATYFNLIQKEGFPSVNVPISTISVAYDGSATAVDQNVVKPASKIIKDIEGVSEVTSTTRNQFANLLITYEDGVDPTIGSKNVAEVLTANGLDDSATLTYQTFDAAKFAGEFDVLIGVYSEQQGAGVTEITIAADTLAAQLADLSYVKESKAIEQIKDVGNRMVLNGFDFLGLPDQSEAGVGTTGQLTFYKSVNIGIKYNKGADTLSASDQINEAVNTFNKSNVESGSKDRANVAADFAPLVKSQISSLQTNMLQAFVIIALVSFLLVSWRAGLATSLAMMTVMLITVLVLYLFGMTLNVISLFALILSLGLIVDDATIISEAIDAHHNDDMSKEDIVRDSVGKIARASMAGTITTILAFAPMLFISGILGGFIFDIPATIITALIVSLVVSLSLIPMFASGFLLSKSKNIAHNPIQLIEKWTAAKLSGLVRYTGRNRKKGALITIGFILFSLGGTFVGGGYFAKAGFDIFPKEKDSEEIAVNVNYRPGSKVEDAVDQSELVNKIIIGESQFIKKVSYSASGTQSNAAIIIELTGLDERDDTSVQIADRLNEEFKGLLEDGILVSSASSGAGGPSVDFPVTLRVITGDKKLASVIVAEVKANLEQKVFKSATGENFKASKFLDPDTEGQIARVDGEEYVSLGIGFEGETNSEKIALLQSYVDEQFSGEKYGLEEDAVGTSAGFEESNQDSFKSMMMAFPILLLAMFILLAVQFKSLLQPLFIFMAIPFSFLGVGAGLYYTNNSASFFVMLGFFALVGIAVNNTILITDFANQARRNGLGRVDAIASALQQRFRPLLTTSITSMVALAPLALSDPFWESLSVTLIFGLLSSTFFVVVCFPYYLIAAEVLRAGGRRMVAKVRK